MRVPSRNACWLEYVPTAVHEMRVLLFDGQASTVMVLLCSSGSLEECGISM